MIGIAALYIYTLSISGDDVPVFISGETNIISMGAFVKGYSANVSRSCRVGTG